MLQFHSSDLTEGKSMHLDLDVLGVGRRQGAEIFRQSNTVYLHLLDSCLDMWFLRLFVGELKVEQHLEQLAKHKPIKWSTNQADDQGVECGYTVFDHTRHHAGEDERRTTEAGSETWAIKKSLLSAEGFKVAKEGLRLRLPADQLRSFKTLVLRRQPDKQKYLREMEVHDS